MTNLRDDLFRRVREAAEAGRGIELSREETAWMALAAAAYEATFLRDEREAGNGPDARS